jgi:transcription termination/antitermination protein NusA
MNKELIAIFEYMEREKGIKRELVVQAIEESLLAAARKSLPEEANVTANVNPKTGDFEVFCEKEIVEKVDNSNTQIALTTAQEIDPDCQLGQFIDIEITPDNFGRIAASTAKQIIGQKLRGAERDVIYEEYRHRVGEIVSGAVKRFARGANLIIDLGKVEAIMPARNYPKTEQYQVGDKVYALLQTVQDLENGGAEVILSRNDPDFVKQLFEQEVPEIADGTVVIEHIVREPGYRTKICVRSNDPRVDPVGTCVGVRGARVKAVVRELENEKVDIIPYSDDPVQLLQNALDPVEIRKISVNEEAGVISIVVDDESYATVIGRKGMNARLNGRLIGSELQAQKMTEYHRLMNVARAELAESDLPILDDKLVVPGMTSLIIENLVDAGFDTPRKVLAAGSSDLAEVPGISLELADRILEGVQRVCADAKLEETE